ncbi:MAG: hypothetical protein M1825_004743 [Sarcosagium campestre]|nr:MAG: hypothetical protein M1825_004743 [Sarcosagium campestre]
MGLAGPRKRTKLAHDPNNTTWARSTTGYGHRMLTAQGWAPGQHLGARDAPHAAHLSAASLSHIRVSLKDDTLGIGAKKGMNQSENECTGYDVFQSVLGRLNGKTDETLQIEQNHRDDARRSLYVERRVGSMRFVTGGFLVGNRIQPTSEIKDQHGQDARKNSSTKLPNAGDDDDVGMSSKERRKEKGEKKTKKKKGALDVQDNSIPNILEPERSLPHDQQDLPRDEKVKRSKTSKKKSSKRRERFNEEDEVLSENDLSESSSIKRRKRRKLDRKAERREKKMIAKANEERAMAAKTEGSETPKPRLVDAKETLSSAQQRPATTFSGPQAVRQRYIQQKRMATMDSKALNEIFMVRA